MSDSNRLDMIDCVASQLRARGLGSRFDAGETAAFARQLEAISAELVEVEYPEFKGLTLVPVAGGAIPLGARSHTYREITGFGEAELLDGMSAEDFPTADVKGAEVTGKIRSIGAKWHVSIEDMRAAALMSINVDSERQKQARMAVESKLDKLVLSGGGPFNGLLTDASSQDDTTGAGTGADWSGNVVANIVAGMQYARDAAFADTKGIFADYDFVLSTKCFLKMGLWVPATTAGGGKTVGEFLLSSVPGIRSISHCARLDGAGASGADRLLAFPRDPRVVDALIPIRFEQFAPQLNGMNFTTYCHAKFGGLRIKHPKAIRRIDVDVTP